MTDTHLPDLDLRKELARIDRDRAEMQKLFAEATKVRAEEAELRTVIPWPALLAWVSALCSVATLVIVLLKH